VVTKDRHSVDETMSPLATAQIDETSCPFEPFPSKLNIPKKKKIATYKYINEEQMHEHGI